MNIHLPDISFEWQADWAQIPQTQGWAHHGIITLKDGTILTGHASEPKLQVLSKEGVLLREFKIPVSEAHGFCLSEEGGKEILWIAGSGGSNDNEAARVIKVDMQGKELMTLTFKEMDYTEDDIFYPTSVAVDPFSKRLWIADGYGSNKVHCFSKDLTLLFTLNGSEEVGDFSCPHWVFVDTRKGHSEIYVADRSNDRVQIFDDNGAFLRAITTGLSAPSVFTSFDDKLVIGELNARLVLLDKDDTLMGYMGDGSAHLQKEGWPNRIQNKKTVSPLDDIPLGEFNSPHGITADTEGNIYISEWLLGGRFTKLKRIC